MRSVPHVALIVETSLCAGREILRGIAQYVREHGPWSIYHEPRNLEDSVPSWLTRWRGDGIIVRLQNDRFAQAIMEAGMPAVDVLGDVPQARLPLVHVDDAAIARLAFEHLFERGFRNFGYCGVRTAKWSRQREAAFAALTAAAGCAATVYHLPSSIRNDRSWEAAQDRLAAWIARLPRPVGLMVCHDPRGQRVLEACRRAGVMVPEEVAVIGVDNDEPVCDVSDPPLSSVVLDFSSIGYQAAHLLDQLMRGQKASSASVLLEPRGVAARQSTDVLAMADRDLAEAVRFIRAHACERISVDDVAAHVAISRTVLKRRFRTLLGRSVHEEIVRVRINRARELLAQTDMPIRQVAVKAGFEHQEYLGVVFKARTGATPAGYRRQSRIGPKSTGFGPT